MRESALANNFVFDSQDPTKDMLGKAHIVVTASPKHLALLAAGLSICASALAVPTVVNAQSMPGISVELPPTAPPQPATAPSKKPQAQKKKETTAAKTPDAPIASRSGQEQSIVALVNDEPITGFEIQQRSAMIGGSNLGPKVQANFKALIQSPRTTARLKEILSETIKANEGKSKEQIIQIFEARKKDYAMSLQKQALESAKSSEFPNMKKAALDELIDEKLKLQEAKRMNVVVGDDEVDRVLGGIAERNKMTKEQMTAQLGGGADAMRNRIRSTLSWTEVVRRQYGGQIQVTSRDVDKMVAANTAAGEDDVELQIQRIRIAIPAKLDQTGIAARMQDAEKVRAKFTDCKTSGAIATGVAGAKFDDLGKRKPGAFQEPTRTMLLNAKDGEMLPPSVGDGGVDLFIVCGRDVVKAEDQKRTQAEGELKQKEFDMLSKRKLKDLRQDAHIEYR